MQLLRTTPCVLALSSPLAGCFSYESHEGSGRSYGYDNGYYGDRYSGYYDHDGRTYYYYRHDED
jgi:hypothetical protein